MTNTRLLSRTPHDASLDALAGMLPMNEGKSGGLMDDSEGLYWSRTRRLSQVLFFLIQHLVVHCVSLLLQSLDPQFVRLLHLP